MRQTAGLHSVTVFRRFLKWSHLQAECISMFEQETKRKKKNPPLIEAQVQELHCT